MSSHLLGNSLTSISSLQTLPPSPRYVTQSSHDPSNGHTATDTPPSLAMPTAHQVPAEQGSVPSPRPRAAHLVLSAPAPPRPRMLRAPSSPTSSTVHVSSPLDPACQKKVQSHEHHANTHFIGESVPEPRPPRLFSSSLSSSEPDLSLLSKQDQAAATPGPTPGPPLVPVLHRARAPSRARPIVVPDMALLTHHPVPHTAPVPIAALSPKDPSEDDSSTGGHRAPSSYSDFIQSVLAPRHNRMLSFGEEEQEEDTRADAQDGEFATTGLEFARSPDTSRKLAWVI